jgi:hypothetical protein
MLYATLMCSDEACDAEFEAWGELEDFDDLLCEGCGCLLVAIAFAEADPVRVIHLPARPRMHVRRAA